jgi:hypothetical protein
MTGRGSRGRLMAGARVAATIGDWAFEVNRDAIGPPVIHVTARLLTWNTFYLDHDRLILTLVVDAGIGWTWPVDVKRVDGVTLTAWARGVPTITRLD